MWKSFVDMIIMAARKVCEVFKKFNKKKQIPWWNSDVKEESG